MIFVSKYDHFQNKFGGMVRVKDIADLFSAHKHVFLEVTAKKPLSFQEISYSDKKQHCKIGCFNFLKLNKVIKRSSVLYVHTVGNFIKIFPYIIFSKRKRIILDVHGAQPEEFKYLGQPIRSFFWSLFERIAFRFATDVVYVSNNMKTHFEKKYPRWQGRAYTIPIFPASISNELISVEELHAKRASARAKLGVPNNVCMFIYSGGIQSWQNASVVVDFIRRNTKHENLFFCVLSNQIEYFKRALSDLKRPNLIMASVEPSELYEYYCASNYGMIFRDDNVLNYVSSPTKLAEYLYYGIIPVMMSTKVGDYVGLGIDYVNIDTPIDELTAIDSSVINHEIVVREMKSSDRNQLLSSLKYE